MTLADVLAEVRRRGIRLTPGGTPDAPILHCRPRSAVQAPPDLTPHLREHKPALLSLLGGPPAVTPPTEAPPGAIAAPPASAPPPAGRMAPPPTKHARAVPHELSLHERVESGYVNPGWTPHDWAARLRQLAERCAPLRPELAATYRRWADNVKTAT